MRANNSLALPPHHFTNPPIMASGDDGQKSSWTSWFSPGDSRGAKPETQQHNPDIEARRPMASPAVESQKSPDNQHQDTQGSGSSPFVSFKHFVDDQFAALTDLPTNLRYLLRKARDDRIADCKRKEAFAKRWVGDDTLNYNARLWEWGYNSTEESRAAASMLTQESLKRNAHVPLEKICALYHGNGGWSNTIDPKGFLSIYWFKHDPYSPIALELDPVLSKYDTKWRHSFEDLLEAALDKPLTSEERFGHRSVNSDAVSTWRGPGLDWMLSLLCRGILPPQLPVWLNHKTTGGWYWPSMKHPEFDPRGLSLRIGPGQPELLPPVYNIDFDNLAREIATPIPASRQSNGLTEFDMYERFDELAREEKQDNAGDRVAQPNQTRLAACWQQGRASSGKCPDELGRAVGKAARQEAEEATDGGPYEKPDNSDTFDFEAFLARYEADATLVDQAWQEIEKETRESLQRLFRMIETSSIEHPDLVRRLLDSFTHARQTDPAYDSIVAECRTLQDLQARLSSLEEENKAIADSFESECARREEGEEAKSTMERPVAPIPPSEMDDATFDYQMQLMIRERERQRDRRFEESDEDEGYDEDEEYGEDEEFDEDEEENWEETPPAHFLPSTTKAQNTKPTVATELHRPRVLSTMTQTQTTRLPDGSLKTEVVLKRRFADGREETRTSVQTSFDGDDTSTTTADGDDADRQQTKNSKGWFWS